MGIIDISIDGNEEHNIPESIVLLIDESMGENEKKQILIKLHQQFIDDDCTLQLFDQIVDKCDVCLKDKKPTPKPTVGSPRANDHNQSVAVDLHEL